MRALLWGGLVSVSQVAAQWETVGGGVRHGQAVDMLWRVNEGLIVTGNMHHVSDAFVEVNGIGLWTGAVWQPFGSGVNDASPGYTQAVDWVYDVIEYDGDLVVAGTFDSIGNNPLAGRVARWRAGQWEHLDSIPTYGGNIYGLSVIDDELHLHGNFDSIANVAVQSWAIWNGEFWRAGDTSGVFSGSTKEAIKYNDRIYVGGNFQNTDGRNDLLMKVGDEWVELGPGLQGDCYVSDLEVYGGLLWVTGFFFSGAGNAATGVMAWDGEQWSDPFPQMEMTNWGRSLHVCNGKLYIIGPIAANGLEGEYRIAEYDGEQLCIRGGNAVWTAMVEVSPDTIYANACTQVDCNTPGSPVVDGLMKMPLDWPADTCYAVVQGIQGSDRLPPLRLVPNPAVDHVTLANVPPQGAWCVITDALGRTVIDQPFRRGPFAVGKLVAGVYQLTLRDGNDRPVAVGRFVKE